LLTALRCKRLQATWQTHHLRCWLSTRRGWASNSHPALLIRSYRKGLAPLGQGLSSYLHLTRANQDRHPPQGPPFRECLSWYTHGLSAFPITQVPHATPLQLLPASTAHTSAKGPRPVEQTIIGCSVVAMRHTDKARALLMYASIPRAHALLGRPR